MRLPFIDSIASRFSRPPAAQPTGASAGAGFITDSLQNLVAGLGTSRDKASASTYMVPMLSDVDLLAMYRTSWLARKIVDIIPLDATRQWRKWQAEAGQIEGIEAEEQRLGLREKVRDALTKARLFGGAGIYIGTRDTDPSKPLDPARIGKGGLLYLAVIPRQQLTPSEVETDPISQNYGKPKMYQVSGALAVQNIHPSRIVQFLGAPLPDTGLAASVTGTLWQGDSVLIGAKDAIEHADSVLANVASMVFEAKVDVISIPDFMENVSDKVYRSRVLERLQLAAIGKGINGMLAIDANEKYETKQLSFGNLPELTDRFLQVVSGAADIPATRLLGQSPAGLSSTGESDTRNYYDRIRATQELDIGPAMQVLDECLIRSALGNRPADVHYEWASLWQSTPEQRAATGKVVADTIVALNNTKLWPVDVLSEVATNMLTECGAVPGLESAMDGYIWGDDDMNEVEDPIETEGEISNDQSSRN